MIPSRSFSISHSLPWISAILIASYPRSTLASTPNVIVSVEGFETTWMAKRGEFGSSDDRLQGLLVHAPTYDELLCQYFDQDNKNITPIPDHEPWIMMVPRGLCSFEDKLYAAKAWYKASGILVYDNLSARYRWNETTQRVRYPKDEVDYECAKGFGLVHNISLDPPQYQRAELDPILDMRSPTTNCTLEQTREPCESQLCLVTGPPKDNSSGYPVCCAWDLPVTMTMGDDEADPFIDDVMAVFLTIRQGEALQEYVGRQVIITARPYKAFNASMIFLWLMAVFITFLASWFATSDLRIFRAKLAKYQQVKQEKEGAGGLRSKGDEEAPQQSSTNASSNIVLNDSQLDELVLNLDDLDSDDDDDDEETPNESLPADEESREENDTQQPGKRKDKQTWSLNSIPPKGKEENKKGDVWVLYSLPPPDRKKKQLKKKQRPGYKAEHTAETDILPSDAGSPDPEPWATPIGGFEMTHWHVFGFIIMASAMLFLLFYFKFYGIIFIFYGFGCSGAVSYVIFGPVLVRVVPKLGDGFVEELNKPVLCGLNGFDATSQLLGLIWAIVWIWYGMSHYRPSTNAFFWITMNIFGACFCILALSMMKLNNIKIATMLMIAVFFYDIFFVFITPLFLDGQSIMITVARGGAGESTADDFCFKYPEDKLCTGIDYLPMLLAVPRINDYRDGMALLGLGDIVLPGYLIAFCARLDEAKRIVGKHTRKEIDFTERWYQGYFFWLMVAYAVGLSLAFLAFGLTEVGQPALLYLVPCCLLMICIVGRKELKDLWTGSRAIRLAEKVKVKCERAWGKEKMRRQVAKAKASHGEREGMEGSRSSTRGKSAEAGPRSLSVAGDRSTEPGLRSPGRGGRGRSGRGRGSGRGRDAGRGRMSGRGRAPTGSSGRNAARSASPSKDRQASLTRNGSSKLTSPSKAVSTTKSKSDVVGASDSSPRRKYAASLDAASPSPRRESNQRVPGKSPSPPKPDLDEDLKNSVPKENDICFGDSQCLGTKHLRSILKKELKADPNLECSPAILKTIHQRLDGRKFFVSDGNSGWKEASKNECRSEISKVFRSERSKLQSKNKASGNN